MSSDGNVGSSKASGEMSAEERELREKVERLIRTNFAMDWRRAFDHYASDSNAAVNREELLVLLEDAGIGNWATRGAWADGVMKKFDKNGNKQISWAEFEEVLGLKQ